MKCGFITLRHVIVVSMLYQFSTSQDTQQDSTLACATGNYFLSSGLRARRIDLYIPRSYTPSSPIVFLWHGFTESPDRMEDRAKMIPHADVNGWVLVYPHGTALLPGFNGMGCCVDQVDDVLFAKDILEYLKVRECGDTSNVFSTGFANGGFMSHRLGCEAGLRPDGTTWFKAIAPHSGLIGSWDRLPPMDEVCVPEVAIPTIGFHGTDDLVVPYGGTDQWYGFNNTMTIWKQQLGCDPENDVVENPTTTTECTKNVECGWESCTITSLGHSWSGESITRDDIDATTRIVEFFKAHGAQHIPGGKTF